DLAEYGEWCSNEIHAAHELLSTVREHPIDHHRDYLESVRCEPRRQREATFDVIEDQAKRLVLPVDLGDEHSLKLVTRHGLGRTDDEVGLPRHRRHSRLTPPVAVRMREARDRRARHEESGEHSVLHDVDAPRRDTFVVIQVIAGELGVTKSALGRIEVDAEVARQQVLTDLPLEGLSLFLALLPMAFDAMTEDLMEEHAARAAGENSRRGRGGDDRRFLQGMQVVDH